MLEREGQGGRTVGRAGLALAVVAVVVAGEERGVHVNRVGDGVAEAVSGESHVGCCLSVMVGYWKMDMRLGLRKRKRRDGVGASEMVKYPGPGSRGAPREGMV